MIKMIFGYVSKKEYSSIENYLEEYDPKGTTFRYKSGGKKAFFFRGYSDFNLCPVYQDSTSLFLCDGIPIRGSLGNGYELVEIIDDKDLRKGFHNFIDEIVSNVSTVLFKNGNHPKLYLSSDRAGPGRIYYRYINGGIAFSSSLSVLLHFAPSRINYEAIYSILKYDSAPPPLTLSKDVYVVPQSHYVTVDLLEMRLLCRSYFRFRFSMEHGFNLKRLDALLDAVCETLGQINGCILLSGGVDSTLLAHKMHDQSNANIRSYFLALGRNDPELTFAREASESTNSQNTTFLMDNSRLVETLYETVNSHDDVFKDICTIPTYYLMKRIVSEGEKIVIDGCGADTCFGSKTIASEKFWTIASSFPRLAKKLLSTIYSQSGIWTKEGSLERILRVIAQSSEIDVILGPLVNPPPNSVLLSNHGYDKAIGRCFTNLVDKLTIPRADGQLFKERTTVATIIAFSCPKKTHLRNKFPATYTLYPYLWKDLLEEQGKIPWSVKFNKGVVKWPLKKLLESYMPHDFVHRKQRAFDPDFESYLKDDGIYNSVKEICTNPKAVDPLISKSRLIKLVERLPTIERFSFSLCNLFWGILFVELWTSKHRDLLIYDSR